MARVKPEISDYAFFTPNEKKLGGTATKVNTFYTDFYKNMYSKATISTEPVAGPFWRFQTNLDYEDLTLFMSDKAVRSFLIRMWDIYRYRKVG